MLRNQFSCFENVAMAPYSLGLSVTFLLCMLLGVESNVRFVCPRPADPRSDISFSSNQSMGYCGVDMNTNFEREHIDVRPGLFTLRFEETLFHRNSPFRITLHSADSEDYCLLLDHIPHNNYAVLTSDCSNFGNKFPIGTCDRSMYYITVNIPDIECDRCYLRLTQIILDPPEKIPCDLNNGTCEGYVSCTNVKIIPSVSGTGKNISQCLKYEDNLGGKWPFRPQEYYRVEFGVGHDKVDPMVIFDSLHSKLHLDIPRLGFPTQIQEVQVMLNESIVWNMTVTEKHRLADTVVVIWTDMEDENIEHLRNGSLVLNIICNKGSYTGNITLQYQNYSEGQYVKPEATEFSTDGWLADYRFRGLYAKDLTVVTPAGPCAPTPRYFISFLHTQQGSDFIHGILAASIVGDFIDITVALYGIKDDITAITIVGSELLGAPNLNLPLPKERSSILQLSLDISRQIRFINTIQFFKSVMVETKDPAVGLSGTFEEGIYTILRDGRDVKGIGAFQFTKGQWLKYEVLITGLESNISRVELTDGNDVTHSLSDGIWQLDHEFCLVEGLVQDLNSKLLLRLWQGRLQLMAYVNKTTLRGMVTAPGSLYCQVAKDTACFSLDLTPDGKPVKEGQEKVLPSGKAVFLLDGAHVLQYSIEIDNLVSQPHDLEASVRGRENLWFVIKLQPDSHHATTYFDTNHLQVTADLKQKLAAGGLKVELFPPSITPLALRGYLPPIKDHLCVQPRNHIIGEHRGFWSPEAAPFKTLFAIVGDSLVFKYSDNVSLYSFPTKEDLLACNFSAASRLGPESNNSELTYIMQLDKVESLHFSSDGHCNDTPPLILSVSVIKPVPPAVGDTKNVCGSLVFSDWRRQRLNDYSGPEPTGPALTGVIIGILVALAFFFWDRRLQQKAEMAVPGTRFQRF